MIKNTIQNLEICMGIRKYSQPRNNKKPNMLKTCSTELKLGLRGKCIALNVYFGKKRITENQWSKDYLKELVKNIKFKAKEEIIKI